MTKYGDGQTNGGADDNTPLANNDVLLKQPAI